MWHRTAKYRGYVSEFDQFLGAFMKQHPEVEPDQRRGWYIWWDHTLDLAEIEKAREDSVDTKPYYYF